MRTIFKKLVGKVLMFTMPYSFYIFLKNKYYSLYSIWIANNFKCSSQNVRFLGVDCLLGAKNIEIGCNVFFGSHLYLTAWPGVDKDNQKTMIKIGDNCSFGAFNHITAANSITIGDGFLTGKWVTITDNNHGYTILEDLLIPPVEREVTSKGPVLIGCNVWIGDKATILPGISIGEGAIIAANTVVTHDVPAYCVCAGNPDRIIKQLNKQNE